MVRRSHKGLAWGVPHGSPQRVTADPRVELEDEIHPVIAVIHLAPIQVAYLVDVIARYIEQDVVAAIRTAVATS